MLVLLIQSTFEHTCIASSPRLKSHWYGEGGSGHNLQARRCLRHRHVELLLNTVDAASDEAHPHDQ